MAPEQKLTIEDCELPYHDFEEEWDLDTDLNAVERLEELGICTLDDARWEKNDIDYVKKSELERLLKKYPQGT